MILMEGKIIKIHIFKEGIPIKQSMNGNIEGVGSSVEHINYLDQISARPEDFMAESKSGNYIARDSLKEYEENPEDFAKKITDSLEKDNLRPSDNPIILDFNVPLYYAPDQGSNGKYFWSPEGNLAYCIDKDEQEKFGEIFNKTVNNGK